METRIALIGIIVESTESVEQLNHLLHEYGSHIIGRMGIPYREKMFTLSALPSMHRRMSSMHCRERSDGWRESRQRPSIPMYKRLRNGDLYDTRGKNHRAPEDGEDAVGG